MVCHSPFFYTALQMGCQHIAPFYTTLQMGCQHIAPFYTALPVGCQYIAPFHTALPVGCQHIAPTPPFFFLHSTPDGCQHTSLFIQQSSRDDMCQLLALFTRHSRRCQLARTQPFLHSTLDGASSAHIAPFYIGLQMAARRESGSEFPYAVQ